MSPGERRSTALGGPLRRLRRQVLALGVGCLAMAPARAQGPPDRVPTSVYFDTSNAADAQLRSAANHVRGGHFAEAVEIYQRIITTYGDKVVETASEPTDPALRGLSQLSIDVRQECHRRIAALPAEARALYRARVDGQAERWYRQGETDRDRTPLRRVIDQTFCSSWGDDALELLGDLAFQDGMLEEALAFYTRLRPNQTGAGGGEGILVHPDPSVALPRIDAKKLLVRAAIGENPPTAEELAEFAQANTQVVGPFAGRRGPLARDLVEAIRDDRLASPSTSDARWPTFAGAQTRTRVAPHPIDVGSLQWRVELEAINPSIPRNPTGFRFSRVPVPPPAPDKLLAFHPIVVGDQVIVDDSRQVVAYNLSGRPAESGSPATPPEVAWRVEKFPLGSPPPVSRPFQGLARHTLTAFGDRVYARKGPPPTTEPRIGRNGGGNIGPPTPSSVLAIDRTQTDKRVLWEKDAATITLPQRRGANAPRNVVFEGTPVADGHNVYIALTDRVEMTAAYVVALDAATGDQRWIRSVCEASGPGGDVMGMTSFRPEVGLRLLTLDGSTLYLQTNLGALASLDAETGSIRWLATYPTRRALVNHDRDLNPAIIHDGMVLIAPNDASAIFAFEASTGRILWRTEDVPEDVRLAHLLGVSKGKLVATGDRVLIYDVKTGKLARVWPELNQATQGFGRGVLAGDRIYWPTRNEIHVLDGETGLRAEPPIRLQETFGCEGGNLAVGDGYLLVAQSNALVAFCQTSRLIERYKAQIALMPEKASNYYRLAQVAEATGRDEEALASLEMIPDRVRPAETVDGQPLAELTRDQQRRLLIKLGSKARTAKNWDVAAGRFEAAAQASRTDRDRLTARLELAGVLASGDRPADAVRTLQGVLADDRLRTIAVEAPEGNRSVRVDLLVADRLAGLIRAGGRSLYAPFDRDAAALLDRGVRDGDVRLLEDVGHTYPVAEVVPAAWQTLARLSEEKGRFGDAARAYKKLLATAPDDPRRARALWGLAQAYERQKLWTSARDAYLQAAARFAAQTVDGVGDGKTPVGSAVADRLRLPPFGRMAGDVGGPRPPSPLRRRWDLHPAHDVRPLTAAGTPPTSSVGRVFLAQGTTLRSVDPESGISPWVADLDEPPVWVGYLTDRLLAATHSRLVAINLQSGAIEWRRDVEPTVPSPDADPFGRAEPLVSRSETRPTPGRLAGFRIVGNRLFCLQGDHTLLAHDGDSGLLEWSYTPAAGVRLNPRMLVGNSRIVVQTERLVGDSRKPVRTLVLDTDTGRRQADFAADDEESWPVDPLAIDEDHVALVVDRVSLALLDINRGAKVWTVQMIKDLPKSGSIRLIGDAERLLVLDGRTLQRIDSKNGGPLWPEPQVLGLEDLSERPEALAVAGDRVYVSSAADLKALDLADGKTIWSRPLLNGPDLGWVVTLAEHGAVATYPDPARAPEGSTGSLPLLFFRREDGALIQRFVFPTSAVDLAVLVSPLGAVVASRDGLWALGDQRVMDGGAKPE